MGDMGVWLHENVPALQESEVSLTVLLIRMSMALVLGALVAGVYRITQRTDSTGTTTFISTLVLLSILIAAVSQVIGQNQALAFSLVGILGIVRFRTTVEDTRDTVFVIFAVVVGMSAGVGNIMVALASVPVVGLAAFLLRSLQGYIARPVEEWTLQLRVGTSAGGATPWEAVFAKYCDVAELQGTITARQGAALDVTYRVRLKAGVTSLQLLNELNRVEGIQNLDMKRG
jgi:hypothetical protein